MAKAPAPSKVVSDLRKLKEGKEFRFPTLGLLGDGARVRVRYVTPTGLSPLDHYVLGVGGIPAGRMVEISGPESAGKDTLMDRILAGAQREGSLAALIENEHKWDMDWARLHGVDTENLILDSLCLEDSHGLIEELIKRSSEERRSVIVLNSVAATPTRKEIDDGATGELAIGEQARLWSRFCRTVVGGGLLARHHATLVVTNQIRMKIGVMYGNPETTPGGNAIKHYAQVRLAVGHGKFEDGKGARQMKVTAVKNQAVPPFRSCQLRLSFTQGFDDRWAVLTHAKDKKVIPINSRSYSEALAALKWPAPPQGTPNAAEYSLHEGVDYDSETGEVFGSNVEGSEGGSGEQKTEG